MQYLVLFLGRSLEGILKDVRAALPGEYQLVIVARDGDQLPPPAGLEDRIIPISEFQPELGAQYTVIANGGTASQMAPTLLRLCRAGVSVRVFDVQRDGVAELK